MERSALVAHAHASIAKGSKSFAMASRLFDRETRERAWLLYGWCRACDDIADGQDHGGALSEVDDARARLAEMRAKTASALAGETTADPAFDGLSVVAAETCLPHRYAEDLIEGFALDAAGWRPQTTDDLMRYCYHVAGAVGCMMAVVMGVPPDDEAVLDRACDLGLAFQLANIARDIREDAEAGRCYIPADWLAEEGISADTMMLPENRGKLAAIGSGLADLSHRYEESARHGTPALSFRSAWAVLAAAGIYGDIAREVARRGQEAWDQRVITSKTAKLGWVAKAAAQALERALRWPTNEPRDPNLWQRPRV
jgi:phytoene synthase